MEKAQVYINEFESIRKRAGKDKIVRLKAYFELFCQIVEEVTASEGIHFNTLFSRLAFAGTKYNMSKSLLYYAHLFRKNIEKNVSEQVDSNLIKLAENVIPSLIKSIHGIQDRIWFEQAKELDEIFRKVDRKIVQFHPVVEALVLSVNKEAKTLCFIEDDDLQPLAL